MGIGSRSPAKIDKRYCVPGGIASYDDRFSASRDGEYVDSEEQEGHEKNKAVRITAFAVMK